MENGALVRIRQQVNMHYSKRFDSLDLAGGEAELAKRLRALREAGIPVRDLTQSNPTRAGLLYPEEAIRAALSRPESLIYRPDPKGLAEARAAVAAYYGGRGWAVNPDQIVLTSGTSEAYSFLLKLLCDPGDEILVPSPGYPLLDYVGLLENVELLRFPLSDPFAGTAAWRVRREVLEAQASARTRALAWIQPNNPTGNVASAEDAAELLSFAAARGLSVIVDEVFADYLRAGIPFTPLRPDSGLVFTLNGVSKILALPQMKLSWIVIDGPAGEVRAARERLEIIADTYLSVNTPVQAALSDLMKLAPAIQDQIRARLEMNEAQARAALAGQQRVRCVFPEGGWYLVLRLPDALEEEEFTLRLLSEAHVHAHPGYMFGFDEGSWVVVSLLTPPEEFGEGMRHLLTLAGA